MRAFLALDLQGDLRRQLGELRELRSGSFPGLRWARPEGIHLTLRFLGQATSEQIAGLLALLEPAARAIGPIDATVAGLGLFPDRGAPGILWLGISADESLLQLQAACEAAAVAAGFSPERRPFRPHLTLGRWRDRVPRPALPSADLGPTRCETFTLFRSELGPGGSVYTVLGRFRLGA